MRRSAVWTGVAALPMFFGTVSNADPQALGSPELRETVTSTVSDTPLRNWLQDISRQTHVRLRLAADYEDRAITARISALPLGKVMQAVAHLYGDFWARSAKSGGVEYVLERSLARRHKQAKLLAATKAAIRAELVERCRLRAQNGTEPGLLHPNEAGYADEFRARGQLLSAVPENMLDRIFNGERVRLNVATQPGSVGDAARTFMGRFGGREWNQRHGSDAWLDLYATEHDFQDGPFGGMPLKSLGASFISDEGRGLAFSIGIDPARVSGRLDGELDAVLRSEQQPQRDRRRLGGSVLDQELARVAQSPRGQKSPRSDLLLRAAIAAGANLLADSHTKPPCDRPSVGGLTLAKALDAICQATCSRWSADGAALLIRSRYWWLDDDAEPPATLMVELDHCLNEKGLLTLNEAAEVALLSPRQQIRVGHRVPEAAGLYTSCLRFYATLSPSDRRRALSPDGLDLSRVPMAQRRILFDEPVIVADRAPISPGAYSIVVQGRAIFMAREKLPPDDALVREPAHAEFLVRSIKQPDHPARAVTGFSERVLLPRRARPKPRPTEVFPHL